MENLKECEICKGKRLKEFIKTKDYLVSGNTFTVVQCEDCGFLFTNPRPGISESGQYYASNDYISHSDSRSTVTDKIYNVIRNYMMGVKCSILAKHLPLSPRDSQLLDYGCATGEFLRYASGKGFEAIGYEPDANARNKAVSKGLSVMGDLKSFEDKAYYNNFDAITLWHVLEHVPDLTEKVRFFSTLLKKDGLIVVAVPQYKSYDAKLYKNQWAAWDVPRHLNHFDDNSMLLLFNAEAFSLVKTYPLRFDAFYISLLSEKSKGVGILKGWAKALINGLRSDFWASTGKYQYSSKVYVFRKTA